MTYVCVKKCFFRGRLWALGETLVPSPGEVIPKHFTTKGEYKPEPKKPEPVHAKTLHELGTQSAKAANAAGQLTAAGAEGTGAGPVNAEGQGAADQTKAGDATPDFLK